LKKESSFFLSALNLITGNDDEVKFGWWIGATDEVEEGRWKWKHSGENVTYLPWYNVRGNPRNENYKSFGGADCSAVVPKDYFLDVEFEIDEDEKKEIEEDKKWRKELRIEEDFKWIDISCYTRKIVPFHIIMSPLCKM